LMLERLFRRAPVNHARELGRLGGRALAEKRRKPIRERTKAMRAELGLPADARLA